MRVDRDRDDLVVMREAEPAVEPEAPVGLPSTRPAHAADPAQRRRLLPWAILAAVGVVLLVGGVVFTYTPFFAARNISVTGASHESRAEILRIARLGTHTNLFHLDAPAAERRLEGDPWIARATITRRLPRSLSVVVVERTPVAVAALGAGPVLVAADGTILGPAVGDAVMPHVGTSDGTGISSRAELRTGARVVAAMTPELRASVASVAVGLDGSVLVVTTTGVTVTYGDGSQPTAKAEALRAVLDYARQEHATLSAVDLTVPSAPTATRPGGTAAVVGR